MKSLPVLSVEELLTRSRFGEFDDLGPVVQVTEYGPDRRLPLGMPVITIADEPVADSDLSFGATPDSTASDNAVPAGVLATIHAQPQAAIVTAQLLRTTERLPIQEALLAESLAYSLLQSGSEFQSWLSNRSSFSPMPEEIADTVQVFDHDRHSEVRLTRPRSANALDQSTRQRLTDILSALEQSTLPIHFTGEGKHFCAGGDLREFGSFDSPVTSHMSRVQLGLPAVFSSVAGRIVAHIHGSCIGAGIELSAFAAKVIAAPNTRIRLPEIAMGLLPGSGGTVSVPRRIGRHRALQLMLDPDGIDATTAAIWGLVDTIEP